MRIRFSLTRWLAFAAVTAVACSPHDEPNDPDEFESRFDGEGDDGGEGGEGEGDVAEGEGDVGEGEGDVGEGEGEDPTSDLDADGIDFAHDNCPRRHNPAQRDVDEDGVGNACDNCTGTFNPDQAEASPNG